ncbi:MAG: hypothetical protein NVS2B2_10130 [Ktedonobacteraceae bacterium]
MDHRTGLLENIGSELQETVAPGTSVEAGSLAVLAVGFVYDMHAKCSPNEMYHVQELDYFQIANYYS